METGSYAKYVILFKHRDNYNDGRPEIVPVSICTPSFQFVIEKL